MCMQFYRRDTHIAEVQMGVPSARLEDACTADNFDVNKLPYITLVGKLNCCQTDTSNWITKSQSNNKHFC